MRPGELGGWQVRLAGKFFDPSSFWSKDEDGNTRRQALCAGTFDRCVFCNGPKSG
jgi:hypothetical protein